MQGMEGLLRGGDITNLGTDLEGQVEETRDAVVNLEERVTINERQLVGTIEDVVFDVVEGVITEKLKLVLPQKMGATPAAQKRFQDGIKRSQGRTLLDGQAQPAHVAY